MSKKTSSYKTLFILRHAKSSWNDHQLSDFERPLNRRGYEQAPQIAEVLSKKTTLPQKVISSPANRALTTANFMLELLPEKVKLKTDPRIYEATVNALLYQIQEISDTKNCVMIVGHNPGFSDLVNVLSQQKMPPLPTCALVELRLNIEHWSEAMPECATLIGFDKPPKNAA